MDDDITPKTVALAAYIEHAALRLQAAPDGGNESPDELLFLGNWHDTVPRLLIHDPSLEPMEFACWMILKVFCQPNAPVAFPGGLYATLIKHTKRSRPTVTISLAVLRLTRWFSLCARVRRSNGQYRGNVYALHDEPISLADAIRLDTDYLVFVQESIGHRDERVRLIAIRIWDAVSRDLYPVRETDTLVRLEQRTVVLTGNESAGSDSPFFAVSYSKASQVQLLNLAESIHGKSFTKAESDRGKSFTKAERSSSCLSNIKTTTTTTTETGGNTSARTREDSETAVFPTSLNPSEQILAQRILGPVPLEQHQDLLDELAGRIRAGKHGNPIRNPVGYLSKLCEVALQNQTFLTSAGLNIRAERERAKRQEAAQAQVVHDLPPPSGKLVDRLNEIRKVQESK